MNPQQCICPTSTATDARCPVHGTPFGSTPAAPIPPAVTTERLASVIDDQRVAREIYMSDEDSDAIAQAVLNAGWCRREDVLEEAAKVAENYPEPEKCDNGEYWCSVPQEEIRTARKGIASAIRSLSQHQKG